MCGIFLRYALDLRIFAPPHSDSMLGSVLCHSFSSTRYIHYWTLEGWQGSLQGHSPYLCHPMEPAQCLDLWEWHESSSSFLKTLSYPFFLSSSPFFSFPSFLSSLLLSSLQRVAEHCTPKYATLGILVIFSCRYPRNSRCREKLSLNFPYLL